MGVYHGRRSWRVGEKRERDSTHVARMLLFKMALVQFSLERGGQPQTRSNSSKMMPSRGSKEKHGKTEKKPEKGRNRRHKDPRAAEE